MQRICPSRFFCESNLASGWDLENPRDDFEGVKKYYFNSNSNLSSHAADYVFFDSELINLRQEYIPNFQVLLSDGASNGKSSIALAGDPVLFRYPRGSFTKPIPEFFASFTARKVDFYKSAFTCIKDKPELMKERENLIINAFNSRKSCDIKEFLRFCVLKCKTRPIVCVYSGDSDLPHLRKYIARSSSGSTACCAEASSYYYYSSVQRKRYCQVHARESVDLISHFLRLQYIEARTDKGRLRFSGRPKIFEVDDYKPQLKLTELHDHYCAKYHGPTHDPLSDAVMTSCIFFNTILGDYLDQGAIPMEEHHECPTATNFRENLKTNLEIVQAAHRLRNQALLADIRQLQKDLNALIQLTEENHCAVEARIVKDFDSLRSRIDGAEAGIDLLTQHLAGLNLA